MTPLYKITLDGADITGNFNDRLLTLNVVLHEGGEANTCEIELDDRDSAIEVPPKGRTLEIFMGYKETGLGSLGTYTIDTVRLTWAPRRMILGGRSADMAAAPLKQSRTENYENKTLANIAKDVAGRSGLQLSVIGDVGATSYAMVHQTDESDMNILTRMGRDENAIFTIAGGRLILAKRGDNQSASGFSLGLTLTPPDVRSVSVTLPDRGKYEAATADHFDFTTGQRVRAKAGDGGGAFAVKHMMLNAEQAVKAAEARKNELDRSKADVSVTLANGDPAVTPAGNVILASFRAGINGTYSIQSVEHNYDTAGYTTRLVGEMGGAGA